MLRNLQIFMALTVWSLYRQHRVTGITSVQKELYAIIQYIYAINRKIWLLNGKNDKWYRLYLHMTGKLLIPCCFCPPSSIKLAIWLWKNKMDYDCFKPKKTGLWYVLTLTLPGPSAGVSGSLDSYCSSKPLCSGMGEVVPARTSPTLLPPSPRTLLSLSCFKCRSASIVVTGTVRVKRRWNCKVLWLLPITMKFLPNVQNYNTTFTCVVKLLGFFILSLDCCCFIICQGC